jgi:hypothetical protein
MAKRQQNEKDFEFWEALPDGGRRYWNERKGTVWGTQRMVKIVDADENTVQVVQEIYNDQGELVQRHQKFPVDTGHRIIQPEEKSAENDHDHTATGE